MQRAVVRSKILNYLCLFFLVAIAIAGCANQPYPAAYDPPGFILGLIHGFLILFSMIGSIVLDIRIYAFPNTGFFYDLGYLIGAVAFLGGGGVSAAR